MADIIISVGAPRSRGFLTLPTITSFRTVIRRGESKVLVTRVRGKVENGKVFYDGTAMGYHGNPCGHTGIIPESEVPQVFSMAPHRLPDVYGVFSRESLDKISWSDVANQTALGIVYSAAYTSTGRLIERAPSHFHSVIKGARFSSMQKLGKIPFTEGFYDLYTAALWAMEPNVRLAGGQYIEDGKGDLLCVPLRLISELAPGTPVVSKAGIYRVYDDMGDGYNTGKYKTESTCGLVVSRGCLSLNLAEAPGMTKLLSRIGRVEARVMA